MLLRSPAKLSRRFVSSNGSQSHCHIERQVSERLVKWIGLPLGGGAVILSRLPRRESQLKLDYSFPTEGAGIGRNVAEQILK